MKFVTCQDAGHSGKGPEHAATFSMTPVNKSAPPPLDVLVVDDELLIRWSLTETLEHAGHTVSEASDRASALRVLRESRRQPDVVLLDFRLPDSNDLGLLSAIRQIAPRAQVIMMTAFGTPEVTKGALDLGAYRVINKPFEVHELAALVQQAHDSRPES